MIVADSAYKIGGSHIICQDYALHSDLPGGGHLAMISDGCSSSPNTDIGARLVCRYAACNIFQETGMRSAGYCSLLPCPKNMLTSIASSFMSGPGPVMASDLGISRTCFDVTLAFVMCLPSSNQAIFCSFGDGVVAYKSAGGVDIYDTQYADQMPFYISYVTQNVDLPYPTVNRIYSLQSFESPVCHEQAAYSHASGDRLCSLKDLQWAMVASDGLKSFVDSSGNPVPLVDVVNAIADIKSHGPGFMSRKLHNGLPKICKANGWSHSDDLSVGMIVSTGGGN